MEFSVLLPLQDTPTKAGQDRNEGSYLSNEDAVVLTLGKGFVHVQM